MKKTVVISGGSRGIGSSVVYKFAKKGYDIITCSRSRESLDLLSKNVLNINSKINLHYIDLDLSIKSDCLKFCDFVKLKTKSIDILVNNVGTFIPGKIIDEKDGNLELMMNTNLYSNYVITRGLISIFLDQRKGHIFNIVLLLARLHMIMEVPIVFQSLLFME